MNYFEFYEIPISFRPDSGDLRRKFLLTSKKYHPDFYTLESDEKQAEVLELSTINNQAYKTLSNLDSCMGYVLRLKGVLKDGQTQSLPQTFLMEMMEVNEDIMDLQFAFVQDKYENLLQQLEYTEKELETAVEPMLNSNTVEDEHLEPVLEYYFKKRYLHRIRENMEKLKS
ncbi:MAG: Fe-S protein assembly co-chaperone HscB [Aureispira sp.]|nr:Fe-S protein assembly co-chaperone HscB [Aureispira sp.]